MKVVYIAHPVAGDVAANLAAAKEWVRWATLLGVAPVAAYIPQCEVLDESDPAMRERGLACCTAVLAKCDEVWLCGPRISSGMALEMHEAKRLGIPVVRMLTLPQCEAEERLFDDLERFAEEGLQHSDDLLRIICEYEANRLFTEACALTNSKVMGVEQISQLRQLAKDADRLFKFRSELNQART